MKIWKRESSVDYKNKSFGYASFCLREEGDTLDEIYKKGFLPMSEGDPETCGAFYEARSLRLLLNWFSLNSEKRRVLRKFQDEFERSEMPAEKFDATDPEVLSFCENYISAIHGSDGAQKLKNIFNAGKMTHVSVYAHAGEMKALCFLVRDEKMLHGWFSFYSLDMKGTSFGIYIVLREILAAKQNGLNYVYMGTCYGLKSRYKLNFKPLEFWDGNAWSSDTKLLKDMLKEDSID